MSSERLTAGVHPPDHWPPTPPPPPLTRGGGGVEDGDVRGVSGAEGCEKVALGEWEACPAPSAWREGGRLHTKEAFVDVQ